MPFHPQTACSANADQRLSQIIKLKHLEKPEPAFWQAFEQEFRNRQLTSFVQVQPWPIRFKRISSYAVRKAVRPVAAATAVALAVFAAINLSRLVQKTAVDLPAAAAGLAATNITAEPEVFFTVQAEEKGVEASGQSAAKTIYQVTELSSSYGQASGYQLNAMPVTFLQGLREQSLGAKVISTQKRY